MDLAKFPRVRLCHSPTPLESLENLTKQLGGPTLYIKRDDCTGLATGGNKTRKLEFLMGQALQQRVDDKARSLALHGEPRKGVYLTGRVGGESISLHSEGGKVVLTGAEGVREEVDLLAPGRRVTSGPEAPGTSALDGVLEDLAVIEQPGDQDADDDEKETS